MPKIELRATQVSCSQALQISFSGALFSSSLQEFNGSSIIEDPLFSPIALVAYVAGCNIEQCKGHWICLDGIQIDDVFQLVFGRYHYIILTGFVIIAATLYSVWLPALCNAADEANAYKTVSLRTSTNRLGLCCGILCSERFWISSAYDAYCLLTFHCSGDTCN